MPQRGCEDCGEMADEAKAFCPACGHAFVAEQKRSEESQFQKMDGTMQLGQTMYNQMLSDMGLNLKPAAQTREPIQEAKETRPPVESDRGITEPETQRKQGRPKLLIFGIVGAFLLLGILIVIAGALIFWSRA